MRLLSIGIAALVATAGVSGSAQLPVAPLSPNDPNVVALYGELLRTIAGVPANVGRDQAQAQIAYTVDQSQESCPVVIAALSETLRAPRFSKPVVMALQDVLANAKRCDPRGTASIGGPGGVLSQGPAIGVGGGSSNYSSF